MKFCHGIGNVGCLPTATKTLKRSRDMMIPFVLYVQAVYGREYMRRSAEMQPEIELGMGGADCKPDSAVESRFGSLG